jgi:hypothetical protein
MTDDNASHLVPQVIGGQIEQSGDEVKNVTITTMSQATVQGSNMARGTALIALDKIYSSRNSHQADRALARQRYLLFELKTSERPSQGLPTVRDDQPARIDHYGVPREPSLR